MTIKNHKNTGKSLEQMLNKLEDSTPALANLITHLCQKADELEKQVEQATNADWYEIGLDKESRTLH
ncbi:MAG: hypothetical protein HQL71_11035 [Magnetococcales bacterium]|nr:hypothetical protein [Magnetococcales bacterium]